MKRRFARARSVAGVLLAVSSGVSAQSLDLATTLQSSETHFPKIQSAVEEQRIREGRVLNAEGAFDLALEQDGLVWADGFHDGASLDSRFVKRFPQAGARAFAGYRVTNDDFPVYQQELVTNSGGEFNVGVVFSLLRDRAIDSRRFTILNERLGVREAEIDLTLARLVTQRNAANAYWRWVASGLRVQVHRDLVALASTRMDAFRQRAEAGDVARIFVTENQQYLLRRQAALTRAEGEFAAAAIELSLYLRDDSGTPRRPDPKELPGSFPEAAFASEDPALVFEELLDRHPRLVRIDNAAARERERLRLAENSLLPRVDLGVKASHDLGNGSNSREGFETIVDLTVSIPLERRLGRGAVAEAEAKLRQLELDRRLAADRIATEVGKLLTRIEAAADYAGLTADEAQQARVMADAERKRFAAGASDFFVVNLREEQRADARIRNLDANLAFFVGLTDYHATTVDFPALGL